MNNFHEKVIYSTENNFASLHLPLLLLRAPSWFSHPKCRELSGTVSIRPCAPADKLPQMNDNTGLDTLLADIGEPWATVRDVRFSRSPLGRFAPWSLIFAFCFPDFSFSASRSDPARPSTTLREGLGLPSALSRPVWLQHRVLRHPICPPNSPACQPNTYRSGCPDADKTTGDTPIM